MRCARRDRTWRAGAIVLGAIGLLEVGCSFSTTNGGATGPSSPPPPSSIVVPPCTGVCSDFPSAPMVTGGAPASAPSMFAGSGSAPAPCLTEPEAGALFPNNWLRPRVKVSAPGATLFEFRFSSAMQANDLVVYTASDSWAMDQKTWLALATHVVDSPITVTARTLGPSGVSAASTSSFTIAPVGAAGQMVYWALRGFDATNTDNEELFGFSVGDASVVSVLKVAQVQENASGVSIGCIGCHTATPDGSYVGFTGNYPWPNALASVEPTNVGTTPSFLAADAMNTLTTYWHGIITFSGAHWTDGDRIGVTTQSTQAVDPKASLLWMELGTGTSGVIARQGDPNGACAPSFSHDGTQIVYTSTNANQDGRLGVGTADLYTVPYAGGAGGPATPIDGAAQSDAAEYYPSLSPDDALVAFNRLPQSSASITPTGQPYDGGMYFNPSAEIWVVPTAGGTAVRLAANDPPACTPPVIPNTRVYPGTNGWDNSWAKWSPDVGKANGKSYYWVIFSSYRYDVSPPRGQLYMTAVVKTELSLQTYPAVYLWNQDLTTSNHTPAWDSFKIAPID